MAGVEPSKTRQVYLVLRDRIAGGRLDDQVALPAEQALAAEYGVSRVTVRRALAELEQEGLISRRRGAGTFVLGAGAKPIVADFSDVLANLVAMGRDTAVRLLAFDYREPSAAIASTLKLNAGEKTQFSVRVRLIDGQPFSHLTTHVPQRIGVTYTEADLAARPLLSLLERSGVEIERATQQVTAVLATPEVAAALEVEVGSALLGTTDGFAPMAAASSSARCTGRSICLAHGNGAHRRRRRRRWASAGAGGSEQITKKAS